MSSGNSNCFPKCSPSSRRTFLRDCVCLGTQAAVTSAGDLGGIPRPLDPGAQEMGSAESTEQTAPGGHPVSLGLSCVEMPGK